MPWYYCYADFGPGHQSSDETIVWQSAKLSRDEREELFNHLFGDRDYPIGDIKLTKTITKEEKRNLLSNYKAAISKYREATRQSVEMLKVIEATPTQKTIRPRQLKAEIRSRKTKKLLKEAQKRNREEAAKVKR